MKFENRPGVIDPKFLKQYDCRVVEKILSDRDALLTACKEAIRVWSLPVDTSDFLRLSENCREMTIKAIADAEKNA